MNDISILITQPADAYGATVVLEDITDLAGDGFSFTKAAMGGYISASIDFECDIPTSWRMMNDHLGKRIAFSSPFARNTDPNRSSPPLAWEGCIYTVRIAVDGATVSRSMADVYNLIDVQYAQLFGSNTGGQFLTTTATDAASIARFGTRRLRISAGAMVEADAYYLRDVAMTQYKTPLSNAVGTNRRTLSPMIQPDRTKKTAKVSIDCAGYWEYFDKLLYSNATTSNATLSTIVQNIFAAMTAANSFAAATDSSQIQSNSMNRTQFFSPSQPITARNALELCCALGDSLSGWAWCCGLNAFRIPYYRPLNFTEKYITQLADPSGAIYDTTSGEEVKPYLIEPGYMIEVNDMLPDSIVVSNGTGEARSQMIDTVTFTAPNTLAWKPRAPFDLVNLKLSRLSGGYYDNDWMDFYFPTLT